LMPRCTDKNVTKKSPARAISTFLVIDENMSTTFILWLFQWEKTADHLLRFLR
jgi:hypothetical protein